MDSVIDVDNFVSIDGMCIYCDCMLIIIAKFND